MSDLCKAREHQPPIRICAKTFFSPFRPRVDLCQKKPTHRSNGSLWTSHARSARIFDLTEIMRGEFDRVRHILLSLTFASPVGSVLSLSDIAE